MKFSKSLLAEIKDKILISDVVGKKIILQKKGKEYLGLSPFQNEKTPSFTVNDEKQFYHCFSSNKHGDIFTFLVEVEGLSFPEAVEQLAELAGVELRSLTKAEEYKISLGRWYGLSSQRLLIDDQWSFSNLILLPFRCTSSDCEGVKVPSPWLMSCSVQISSQKALPI